MPEPRADVMFLARLQEFALRRHDAKRGARGWADDPPESLFARLVEETDELHKALTEHRRAGCAGQVLKECADVANFAMMIADVVNEQHWADEPPPTPDASGVCDHPWHRNPGLITPCPECGTGRAGERE